MVMGWMWVGRWAGFVGNAGEVENIDDRQLKERQPTAKLSASVEIDENGRGGSKRSREASEVWKGESITDPSAVSSTDD